MASASSPRSFERSRAALRAGLVSLSWNQRPTQPRLPDMPNVGDWLRERLRRSAQLAPTAEFVLGWLGPRETHAWSRLSSTFVRSWILRAKRLLIFSNLASLSFWIPVAPTEEGGEHGRRGHRFDMWRLSVTQKAFGTDLEHNPALEEGAARSFHSLSTLVGLAARAGPGPGSTEVNPCRWRKVFFIDRVSKAFAHSLR